MNILFANDDENKRQLYELGFKLADKDAKCINLDQAGIKDKYKYKLENDSYDAINCSKSCNLITVSVKEALYIDGLDTEKQPGENYNKIKNKENDSNEIVNHYSQVVKELGGKAKAKVIDEVTIAKNGEILKKFNLENDTYLTSKISSKIDTNNPINSLTLIPEFGDIHFSECNSEEIKFLHEIRDQKNLKIISEAIKEIKDKT